MSTAIKSRKERELDNRRNDILEAVIELYAELDYAGITMDIIAQKAEFTKMTLYSYFHNKDELILSAVLKIQKELNEAFEKAAASPGSGLERVRLIGKAYLDFFLSRRARFKLLNLANHGLRNWSGIATHAELLFENKRMLDIMGGAIEAGRKDGTLRRDIQAPAFALLLVSFSNGFYNILDSIGAHLPDHYGTTLQAMVEQGMDFINEAIKGKE